MSDTDANKITYLLVDGRDLVQNIMKLKYSNLTMFSDVVTDVQTNVNTVFSMHNYNWTKKYATISLVYNALNTIDQSESGTSSSTANDTESGTDTTAATGSKTDSNTAKDTDSGTDTTTINDTKTDSGTNTQTVKRNNFDASAMVTNDETDTTTGNNSTDTNTNALLHGKVQDRTNSGTSSTTDKNTITYGHKNANTKADSYSKTLTGYNGTAPQDMIKKEREIAEYNFYEMIADELIDFITTEEYTF
jgi:hypothetical protein